MEKTRKIISVLIIFTLIFTLIPVNVQAASKIKLNKTTVTVYIGKTTTLKVTGTSKTVKWSTSDKKVATVSSKGKVTAKKAGTATITAKVSNKTYKCKVIVKNPYLNKKTVSLNKGKTLTLKLTGATASKYKSSNTKVATVNNKGKITAKAAGKTTITCTDSNGRTYKCTVTVNKATPTHTHSYKWVTTKEATCNANGIKSYKCDCGTVSKTETIAKLEHKYDNGTITTKATCTKEGERTFKCIRSGCTETKKETLTKLEHNYDNGTITTEATCTKEGERTFKCTRSGCIETKKETIAKTDHDYLWELDELNNTKRTLKCTCGSTGITEEYYNGVWGYFDRAAAENLYYWVNAQRMSGEYLETDVFGNPIGVTNVPALTGFDSLYETAKQRATDIVKNYSHDGMKTDNENISNGWENSQACYEAWFFSTTHARTMTNQIYKTGSCAVFYYDSDNSGTNLYPYYVLVVNK